MNVFKSYCEKLNIILIICGLILDFVNKLARNDAS